MKRFKNLCSVVLTLAALGCALGCNSAIADENNTTNITVNTSKGISMGNIISLSGLTSQQIAALKQVESQLRLTPVPSGYKSWDEFKNIALSRFIKGEAPPNGYSSWEDMMKDLLAGQTPPDGYATWGAFKDDLMNSINSGSSGGSNSLLAKAQGALMIMPVAAQVAGYLNQLNSYDQAFHNADMQMMLPYKQRIAYRLRNKHAVVDKETSMTTKYDSGDILDKGLWVRPYVSTGSINFKNGPKAYNTMYGVFVGGDSSIIHLKRADFQYSAYAGYNGAHISYGSNTVDSNGGLFGVTGNWYGQNAFASLTVNAGANNSWLQTDFTNKDYPLFTAGVAAKTGYNFEFADGKFIIQPSYMMSYSLVTPFSKGSIAGMNIESDPLNVMNISPGLKFIGNLKHGWQPYAEARMVWNLFDKANYSTALVDIPSISIKPYAQYGVGIQKLWGKRSVGFIEFLMRSGGRNDVAFNVGFKILLGKEKL